MNTIAEPLTDLWRRTHAKFARAVAAIGGPARIAAIGVMSSALRRVIVRWLCPLETIVRKLLLAEAARLDEAQPKPVQVTSGRARAAEAVRTSPHVDRTRPETWRARFSLALPRDPRAVPESRAPRIRALWGPPPPPPPPPHAPRSAPVHDPALRLAVRFEAVRRVLQDPLCHARRLARLLRRAIRRFPEILTRYVLAPPRTRDEDAADPSFLGHAFGCVFNLDLSFCDSS